MIQSKTLKSIMNHFKKHLVLFHLENVEKI